MPVTEIVFFLSCHVNHFATAPRLESNPGLDGLVLILGADKNFPILRTVQTCSGAQLASYSMDTGAVCPEV
jgi:hypothetical protein